jgi:hypothetical protein
VSTLANLTGEPLEALIAVSDEEREHSRQLVAAGPPEPFRLVNALALDPWNAAAQAALTAVLNPPRLEGVRSFAVLAFADELAAAPEMLHAYAGCFSGSDDATLVVAGEDFSGLAAALADAGLDGEDGPDLLAVAPSDGLAGAVRAVYSRRPQEGLLASVPRVDDGRVAVLRELAAADARAIHAA